MKEGTVDINKLFDIYIDENSAIELEKGNKLESFRIVESEFKKYTYALGELEKVKNEATVDYYQRIRKDLETRLLNFNPINLKENLYPIYNEIHKIKEMRDDLKNSSSRMKLIHNMWGGFIKRNNSIDMNSIFIQNISDKIAYLENLFENIEFIEISRIEEELGDLRRNIEQSITMIEELSEIYYDFDFIGVEPIRLKKDIYEFITNKYKTLNLIDLHEEHSSLTLRISNLKLETSTKRERVKVIKIENKKIRSVYSYGIELNGVFMNLSDMDLSSVDKIDTEEYIYIDNFPKFGLFRKSDFKDTMNLSSEQFIAIDDFSRSTFKLFLLFVLASLTTLSFTASGSISPLLSIPIVMANSFIFIFIFKGLIIRNNSKYKLPNMFYFFNIDYKLISIGDNSLKYQRIIPLIFINFNKILYGVENVNE